MIQQPVWHYYAPDSQNLAMQNAWGNVGSVLSGLGQSMTQDRMKQEAIDYSRNQDKLTLDRENAKATALGQYAKGISKNPALANMSDIDAGYVAQLDAQYAGMDNKKEIAKLKDEIGLQLGGIRYGANKPMNEYQAETLQLKKEAEERLKEEATQKAIALRTKQSNDPMFKKQLMQRLGTDQDQVVGWAIDDYIRTGNIGTVKRQPTWGGFAHDDIYTPYSAPQRSVVKTGTYNGKKVVQYSDGTVDYQ